MEFKIQKLIKDDPKIKPLPKLSQDKNDFDSPLKELIKYRDKTFRRILGRKLAQKQNEK